MASPIVITAEGPTYSQVPKVDGHAKLVYAKCVERSLEEREEKSSSVNRRRSLDKLKKTCVPSCSSKHGGYVLSQTAHDYGQT